MGRFGTRNAPTASYAAHIPPFSMGPPVKGGQFVDGRASTLEEQAKLPFLNANEMNMADKAAVVAVLQNASYAGDFIDVFGEGAFDNIDDAYDDMASAIAAFERTALFSPFSSKFDQDRAGPPVFSADENAGRVLFNGKAQCNTCHRTRPADGREVFSDFLYSNIGVPANPDHPDFGTGFVDLGLGGPDALNDPAHHGKFRTPTLRNVAVTAPYMHNGVFDTLEEVIEFYNRRDLDGIVPEVASNVDNNGNIGELGLTPTEITQLIAFLNTPTDN